MVLTSAGDPGHGHIAAFAAVKVALDCCGQGNVVEALIGACIEKLGRVLLQLQHGPARRAPVKYDVINAVPTHVGGKVVTGVAVEYGLAVRSNTAYIAARCARNQRGQHAGAKDQRYLWIQRIQALLQQVVQQHHIGPAATKEVLEDLA